MPVFAAVSPNRATGPIRDKELNHIYMVTFVHLV